MKAQGLGSYVQKGGDKQVNPKGSIGIMGSILGLYWDYILG